MQMQPYTRSEPLPVPASGRGTAIAERIGYDGTNGHAGSTNGKAPHAAPTAQPSAVQAPTYIQVLIEQIKKRSKMLGVWLAITAVVAFAAIKTLGKPQWRAEGALYYQPDYSYSQHPLYRPPNIQSVLRDVKSPEVLESLRKEKNIGMNLETLQTKITAAVVKNSDYISVSLDWPDATQASDYANRLMQLLVADHDLQRQKKSKKALEELSERLKKTIDDELEWKNKLNESLGKKNIFDLATQRSSVQSEIVQYQSQISKYEGDISESQLQIKKIEKEIQLLKDQKNEPDGPITPEQLSLMTQVKETTRILLERVQKMKVAQVQLKAKLAERDAYYPLYRKGYMSQQEWLKLEADIAEQRILANGTEDVQRLDEKIRGYEKRILEASPRSAKVPLSQLNSLRNQSEINLEVLPTKIKELEAKIAERRTWQQYLHSVEKDSLSIQQEIEAAQVRRTNLTTQKQENEKLDGRSGELVISSEAKVGDSPASSNHAKLAFAVIALSMLLFLGFVAVRDMPEALKTARAQIPEAPFQPELPVPWTNQAASTAMAPRGPNPEQSSGHLRALAARITENITDRGSIVLFTPAVNGLRIETLVGDLGCYCAQLGGRVLVFDTRPINELSSLPAWAGPSAGEVGAEVENFLMGHSDRPTACFASTLITSIDYSRGDIFTRLNGVLANHRFRKLVEEMRNSYSLVLLITPDMYCGGEDDFLSNLAEGVVVVLNESTDPADVDAYVQNLRANETPVYGAVTVPGRG